MTPAISVSELTKKYGEIEAVRGIDFEVAAGETFGFLGPNGAGKSTTIKILCTLADPTSGTARVAGYDVVTRAGHRAPQHRPGLPGHHAGQLPDRRAEPALPRRAVRGAQGRVRAAAAPGARDGRACGTGGASIVPPTRAA